jgi:hypothetical protein
MMNKGGAKHRELNENLSLTFWIRTKVVAVEESDLNLKSDDVKGVGR